MPGIVNWVNIHFDKCYQVGKIRRVKAEVAKLADALRSGRSELTLMWVRVPPSAFTTFTARPLVRAVFVSGTG